ncbi:MAG: hydroxyacid dehydrogenase [Acidimicrobiia bacterium]|nr:hydroxyacid dehydrogenase [Acidimicrobiia bacterium]
MSRRPRLVLSHYEGIELFDARALDQLDQVGELLDRTALPHWNDPRAGDLLARAEVIVGHWGCGAIDADLLAMAPDLRLFAYAAGTVKFNVTPATFDAGVRVTSGANANALPVADYTLAMILLANKDALFQRDLLRDRSLADRRRYGEWEVGNWDKTVGLVSASLVGRAVIELLAAFPQFEVLVYDPFLGEAEAERLGVRAVPLDELCARSDVVSVHAPLLETTTGLIGAAQLAAMRTGTTLINTARGPIVDHAALLAELESGRLFAVLDVTDPEPLPDDSPFLDLPNAYITPHLAGSQGSEYGRMVDFVVEEIRRFAAGEPPLNEVTAEMLERTA